VDLHQIYQQKIMAKYQTIPEYVEAFQMTAEAQAGFKSWPDWARENSKADIRQVGAIFPSDLGNPENGFSLRTEYGEFPITTGQWIVQADRGYMLIEDQHFQARYQSAGGVPEPEPTAEKKKAEAAKSAKVELVAALAS
jgi:hypothetical protein